MKKNIMTMGWSRALLTHLAIAIAHDVLDTCIARSLAATTFLKHTGVHV